MSTFGDLEPADSFDPSTPEPEPLARFILVAEWFLSGQDPDRPKELEELHPWERALRIYVAARLIERLTHEGTL